MKSVREKATPTVGDLIQVYPEGYAYHAFWQSTVQHVLHGIYHEHFDGVEDSILVVSHSPVIELATGSLAQTFIGEGDRICFAYDVNERTARLTAVTHIRCPQIS